MSMSITGPLLEAGKLDGSTDFKKGKPIATDIDYVVQTMDFLTEGEFISTDWTTTNVDVGAGTNAVSVLAGSVNGVLSLVTAANEDDSISMQSINEVYKLVDGKRLWYECLLNVDTTTAVDLFMGLSITDTTPLDASDFVGFKIADGNASILCKTCKNSTETSTDSGVDIESGTNIKLGFLANGVGSVQFFVNRVLVATHTANINDDEEMCLTIHLQNGSAAARTLLIDYIQVVKER